LSPSTRQATGMPESKHPYSFGISLFHLFLLALRSQ
jgi:hypothetical protein